MAQSSPPSRFVFPPVLQRGSRVTIVAPSSGFPDASFDAGVAILRERYDVAMRSDIRARQGYLAGDDPRRRDELATAMRDESLGAIFCARGGYGATRIAAELPWDDFARAPKWIIGFSDITALHLEANARGVASIHGPNVTGLANAIAAREELFDALEETSPNAYFSGLSCIHAGEPNRDFVEGIASGGNLALVHAMAAANRLVLPRGAILFLEDVTERPYRVDRMLTSLRVGGHLAACRAIVFGDFTECAPGPDGITIDEVLADCTTSLNIPVYSRAPFGHGESNRAITFGATARIEKNTVRFSRA